MQNAINKMIIIIAIALSITSCSSVYDKHIEWQPVEPDSFPTLTAIGYAPISLQKSSHKTQQMLMAINASKIAAYAELTEQVYGQHIDGKTSLSNLLQDNQKLNASIKGIIRGAKVVKSYPVGDTYATELSLDFKDVYDLYLATMQRKEIKDVTYF